MEGYFSTAQSPQRAVVPMEEEEREEEEEEEEEEEKEKEKEEDLLMRERE
jgi:ribosomal protein L12E/L44/L45/RPP1/RPP2